MNTYEITGGTVTLDDCFFMDAIVIHTSDAVWIFQCQEDQRSYIKIHIKDGVPITSFDNKEFDVGSSSGHRKWSDGFN